MTTAIEASKYEVSDGDERELGRHSVTDLVKVCDDFLLLLES